MTRIEDLENIEKRRTGEGKEAYYTQKIGEMIKQLLNEVGQEVKFTPQGGVLLPDDFVRPLDDKENDELFQRLVSFTRELEKMIAEGGKIPEEYLSGRREET